MREAQIEKRLFELVKKSGGMCIKLDASNVSGIPDRLVLLPDGFVAFIELKAPNKKPRPLQVKRMEDLNRLGLFCCVIDSMEKAEAFIKEATE